MSDQGNTFPPSCRIRKPAEYDRVFKAGKALYSAHFKLMVAPGELEWSRLGLVVSRKAGGAVKRNLVKRRLREWFRLHRQLFKSPVDLVVIARPGSAGLTGVETAQELETAVKRWRPE